MVKFHGYRRKSGRIGTRNHVLVFPTVNCATTVAQMISQAAPGTISVDHPHGCGHLGEEKTFMIRTMAGFCGHPNVAGILLVGLGCEQITPQIIATELEKSRQRFEVVNIQTEGGTTAAVERGKILAAKLLEEAAAAKHEPVNISELILGTKCGGSDTLSGITANPALGAACDLLAVQGGTILLSETPEMIGAEHVLAARAISEGVKKRIGEIISAKEIQLKKAGVDIRGTEPSPGNIDGGLSTLEEKSLGAVLKGGSSPIQQVINYAEKPSKKGLVIMDGPAVDAACNTGMIAASAQVIVFTTGRGTPLGSPIVPVIKISSHSRIYEHMKDNFDIDAGEILEGKETISSLGEQILKEIISVASGKITRAEVLGHTEFAIPALGFTV